MKQYQKILWGVGKFIIIPILILLGFSHLEFIFRKGYYENAVAVIHFISNPFTSILRILDQQSVIYGWCYIATSYLGLLLWTYIIIRILKKHPLKSWLLKRNVLITVVLIILLFKARALLLKPAWVEYQKNRIHRIDPTNEELHCKPQIQDDGTLNYTVWDKGIIPFSDGGWVYVVTRSFHAGMNRFLNIGDISFAIDNNGNYSSTTKHLCCGVQIETGSTNGLSNIEHFHSTTTWTKKGSEPIN